MQVPHIDPGPRHEQPSRSARGDEQRSAETTDRAVAIASAAVATLSVGSVDGERAGGTWQDPARAHERTADADTLV